LAYESEVAAAREAADAAAKIIARRSQGSRESWDKAEDNPVTLADLEANRAIETTLRAAFPEDAILSEETRDSPARFGYERVWIIDPLDGTKEFVQGIPEFAVSIALALQGEPVVGVVQQPLTGECFWGARGEGAWLGGERVSVIPAAPLEQSKVLSSRTEMKRGQVDRYRDWFAEIQPVGSVALKLALVAAGRSHGWLSLAPKSEWDVCAGDLLVREAGGRFETWDRGVRTYNQENLLLNPPMAAGAPGWVAALRGRDQTC
jgi:myo-inositol-1(or 4)-monophosphatase